MPGESARKSAWPAMAVSQKNPEHLSRLVRMLLRSARSDSFVPQLAVFVVPVHKLVGDPGFQSLVDHHAQQFARQCAAM